MRARGWKFMMKKQSRRSGNEDPPELHKIPTLGINHESRFCLRNTPYFVITQPPYFVQSSKYQLRVSATDGVFKMESVIVGVAVAGITAGHIPALLLFF